ncbi:MAG: hypothetical protein ACLQOO_17745 [Terriglobia bacterium]
MIPAYSPQARGRSERGFQTWQGRLPQELRLAGVETVEEAHRFWGEHYLPAFNQHFAVPAAEPGHAFVKVRGRDLDRIFSIQQERTVNRDNVVSLDNRILADREKPLAGDAGRMPGDGLRASGGRPAELVLRSPVWAVIPLTDSPSRAWSARRAGRRTPPKRRRHYSLLF